jgi:hypothetical protein
MNPHKSTHRLSCTVASTLTRVGETPTQLSTWEKHVLELISEGAPLPRVLDELCTAVNMQLAGVVSAVVLSADNAEHPSLIAESAARFGLRVFQSEPILSAAGQVLGTFELSCCGLRTPDRSERHVVERAASLAAVAIELAMHDSRGSRQYAKLRGIPLGGTAKTQS